MMRDGAPAPATASALPLIAVVGGTTLSLGALMLRRKRPARARA
jgi:LPXTG-motif cell wall-anchored protein